MYYFSVSKRKHTLSEIKGRMEEEPYPKYILDESRSWSKEKQEAFIEYIMIGYPISDVIMWRMPSDPTRQCHVINGNEQFIAILNFMEDKITCFGKKFSEMRKEQRDNFCSNEIRINVIESDDKEECKKANENWERFR